MPPRPDTLVPVVAPESPLLWWHGFPMAFVLTCLIELPVYLLAFAALGWCRSRPSPYRPLTIRTALGLGLAVNCLTHPALWAMSLGQAQPGRLLAAELGVAIVERSGAWTSCPTSASPSRTGVASQPVGVVGAHRAGRQRAVVTGGTGGSALDHRLPRACRWRSVTASGQGRRAWA